MTAKNLEMENSINLLIHQAWGGMEYVNSKQFLFQHWTVYLIIHNDHGASEEIMMSNYASKPLGGRVLSIYSHSVSIQGIRTLKKKKTKNHTHIIHDFMDEMKR